MKKYQNNALMCGIFAEQQNSGESLLECVLNLGYNAWQENSAKYPHGCLSDESWNYSDMLDFVEEKYGKFARLIIQVGKCHQQIGNGGLSQYWDNDYATDGLHERMCELWDECIPREKETATASKFRTAINAYSTTIRNQSYAYWGGSDSKVEDRIYDNCPFDFLTDRIRCMIYDVKYGSSLDRVTSGRTIFDDPIDDDGNISIKWGREDVRGVADKDFPDDNLTDDEVDSVLYYMYNKHDASLGVNWDTIDFWISEVISER